MEIYNLFPTPVVQVKLERELNPNEINFINENKNKVRGNEGNFTSTNFNVLDDSTLFDLKRFILDNVYQYFTQIISPANDIEPYITLSWINYTYKGGYHPRHSHVNSIISGVFYINTLSDDKIHFYSDKPRKQIDFITHQYNVYNSPSWWIPAEQNTLVLFPSDLMHSVEPINHDETRISLAFNVFIKGEIGSNEALTRIEIK
jgi:uncharacterized protein (TIGR02466 family)